jgi:predicted heme/steroid binding protein
LNKIDRLSAWVLFFSMILFFVSGYGMTKGLFNTQAVINIHNQILPPIVIVAFTLHAWYAIHLAIKRWEFWNNFSAIMLTMFFVLFVGFFLYLQYFYQSPTKANNISSENSAETVSDDLSEPSGNEIKSFNLSELAEFNGENGRPAYVAVDGMVYDLSAVFESGKHYSHYAGKELTTAFYSYHVKSTISKYPVVGELKK